MVEIEGERKSGRDGERDEGREREGEKKWVKRTVRIVLRYERVRKRDHRTHTINDRYSCKTGAITIRYSRWSPSNINT